ncbi:MULTISPECIES: MerR family transcriptional regulator [Marinilactibacillus]|uniref:MerR family transcriptional regulator n=1 Tax=Marinilactibacillus psychrotolerans TaxID=191770 RepID=A0AAV3WUA5_9LACT|nr:MULTISPECIES: MerR family transcriptional regulator [Marinilactibacillus]API88582.1 MerR family transcriptional regulator [Marinilactibacillus sp. 15R]GEL67467.1 HTH-type transcriptional regulator AdhR [Marinilactibacillus psychrotolerans]GEQ35627.1 MerR family transcriptional regulator [Marinilactibacillus psychrotolerans]SDC71217.1 DNA-binding transcriptional regulator, MerR family [Marinilactibacillus psychrotolerans]
MNISKVAEEMNMTPSTIRYYESIDLIPPITRNESGVRIFDEQDLKWIDFVKCMRSVGLPLDVLREYTQLVRKGADEALEKRKQILVEERENLLKKKEEMEQVLNRLDYKINDYEGRLSEKENTMKKLVK